MNLSVVAYIAFLLTVGLGRLVEMWISSRHQRGLSARGIAKVPERHFRWMILLHAGILVSAGLEVLLLHPRYIPLLALAMGLLFILANLLRWWAILSLSKHWNIQVMASTRLGVVTRGPFRWIRHPNYFAIFVELLALPLIRTAWLTAIWSGIAHVWILRHRLAVEERVLLADPAYRIAMASKPRFIPRLIWHASTSSPRPTTKLTSPN